MTPVQFTLSVGHSISGTVTDSVSNDPIPDRNVEIYTTTGNPANCMQDLCEPGSGANVTINGSDVTDIDFALNPGPTISGQVIDTQIGPPILLTVDVFNSSNQRIGAWTTLTSDDASYTTGALLPGEYTLKPRTTATYSLNRATTVTPPVAAQKTASLAKQSVAKAANNNAPPGIISVQLGDSSVNGASMGVLQTVIFGEGGFED